MVRFTVLLLLLAILPLVAGYSQEKSFKEEQDYAFALGLFKDNNYQLAFEKFRQFTRSHPQSHLLPDAEYYMAESQYQNANLADAALAFARFQETYPDSKLADDAGFREGEVYFRQGDFRKAHEQLSSVVKRWPEGNLAHEAAYWAGEAAFRNGDIQQAMRYYRIAYEHYPQGRIRDYAFYSIGFMMEKQENFDDALAKYEEFLRQYPESDLRSSVFTRKAACLYQLGRYSAVLDWIQTLSDSPDPENAAERMFLRGDAHYRMRQFDHAEDLYRSFLNSYPTNSRAPQVQYSLGWTQIEQEKYSEAIATFDALSKGNSAMAEAALFRKGMALRLAGTLEAARTVFSELIAARPEGDFADNAHFELGMAAYNESAFEKALDHFTSVTTRFPQSDVLADAWFMQGETLLKLRRPGDAAHAYASAVDTEHASQEILAKSMFRQGFSLFEAQRHGEAIVVFKNFLQRFPEDVRNVEALLWLGEAHFRNEEFEDAVIAYNQVLVKTQNSDVVQDALYGLGWAHFRAQQFADAERTFSRLTTEFRAGKNDVDANIRLGDAQYAQRKFADAAKTYRYTSRMYSANPLAAYALLQLASSEHRLGNTPAAISTLRGLLSDYPDSEYGDKAQFSLAWMYFQNKDYEVAISEFRNVLNTYPESPLRAQAAYSIADCHFNRGDYAEAERAYRHVLEQYADSPKVSDALDGLTQSLRMLGRDEEAGRVKEDWLATNPRSEAADEVVFAEIRRTYAEDDPARSIPMLKRFIAAHPESALQQEAHLLLGRAFKQNNDLTEAERTLQEAVRIAPSSPLALEGRFNLIETALARQDRNRALVLCQELLKDPAARGVRARIYYMRGMTYRMDGNIPAARQDFLSAREAQPGNPYAVRATIEHAVLLAEDGDVNSAVTALADIATARIDAIGAEAQYRQGAILRNAGRLPEAEEALMRVGYVFADAAPWNARALLMLGKVSEAMEKHEAAREQYRKVLQQFSGSREADEARTRLEMIR